MPQTVISLETARWRDPDTVTRSDPETARSCV